MAKKEETAKPAEETTSNVPATLKQNGKEVAIADILKQVEEAEVGQELGSDYFTLEVGEEARVVFIEMATINKLNGNAGEKTDAVRLLGVDGRMKICADKVIVSICGNLAQKEEFNTPLQITCTGKKKSSNGFSYKEFTVNKLISK